MKAHRILVIGAGNMGAFYDKPGSSHILSHGHAISKNLDFDLVGFVDPVVGQAEKASKMWGGSAFTSLDRALESSRVDVAVVCVPDALHVDVLHRLLEKSSPSLVFTEKPLASTLHDAQAVVQAYGDRAVAISVNYSRRFVKEFRDSADDVRSGIYGAFLGGVGYYGKGLFHNGSHLVDQLLYFTGENFSVEHVSSRIADYEASDPSLSAALKTSRGAVFNLQAIPCSNFSIYELDLVFEKGRLRIVDSEAYLEVSRVVDNENFAGYRSLAGERRSVSLFGCLPEAYQNLSDHLRAGVALLSPADEALEVLSLCDQIRRFQ